MSQAPAGLKVERLSKEYPAPGGALRILDGITFDLDRGGALAVTGPSGSGKSTLLYIVGALESPTSGSARLGDADLFALEGDALAAFRNEQVGFVFQDHHLLPQLTALENVLIPTMAGGEAADAEQRAAELLDRVGLSERRDHLPAELSGGERQRVAIARALVNRPALLLADEPTGNLDRRTADSVAELLFELHRETDSIMILVTHSAELAAAFPRRAELVDGRLEFE